MQLSFHPSSFISPFIPDGKKIQVSGLVWLFIIIASGVPIFWFGLASLGKSWLTPEYSHGPLIPLVSLYLFLRELRNAPPAHQPENVTAPDDLWPGVVLLTLAIVLGIFGNLVRIPDIVSYALILWIGGVVLVGFGWNRGKAHWAPVLHLIFMLVLPQFLYWKLSNFLQSISSEIGVWLIELMGIPVLLEGNIIDLGVYKLQVAEACSGLRYLFPILSFTYLFSILYRGPFWHKAVLFLMAAPLAVLMNSFRIGMIGILVNSYGIGQAEGFLHAFEGWVIFGACIFILFLLAIFLQGLTPNPQPISSAIDLDTTGMAPHLGRFLTVKPTRPQIMIAVVLSVISLIFVFTPQSEQAIVERKAFVSFPDILEQWRGSKIRVEPEIEEVLAADDYLNANYINPQTGSIVNLLAVWYKKQTEGQAIHSPEACLPAGGWEVFSINPTEVTIPNTVYGTFTLNRAIIQKGTQKQLVYYWFEQRGKRMVNDFNVKISVVKDSFLRNRGDGALVRLITPVAENEPIEQADARLQEFMAIALEPLPEYIPE